MKFISVALLLFATVAQAELPKVTPKEAAQMVADDKAVLVDVRELNEWAETGVAQPAQLMPKSDFDGPKTQWKGFLAGVGNHEIILYCRSGKRAEKVGDELVKEGYKVANVGGFADWQKAGLPVRKIDKP